jgi:lipid-A-disaccharide synthase
LTGRAVRFALVAGEASGDLLGASLIEALKERVPHATFTGMAGPRMIAAGCEPVAHIDELSVMGLAEVLRSYPRLWRLRRRLAEYFIEQQPDVMIGIDVPDFNLGLERSLKQSGVPTVHLVCPQAWAWREGRARTIARSTDVLLALLPFEPAFFERFGVKTKFVGHPLADVLPMQPSPREARAGLGVATNVPLIALMPGSRRQELERLLDTFLGAARMLKIARPETQFVLCLARERDVAYVEQRLGGFVCPIVVARSHEVLSAADVAIVASGTVSLEAMLCATPIVVGYRLAPLSYHIIKHMVKVPHIALPNILAQRELVPELIQRELTPEALKLAVLAWLDDEPRRLRFVETSRKLHGSLRCNAAASSADAILSILDTQK